MDAKLTAAEKEFQQLPRQVRCRAVFLACCKLAGVPTVTARKRYEEHRRASKLLASEDLEDVDGDGE